jgi:hypothetical protein
MDSLQLGIISPKKIKKINFFKLQRTELSFVLTKLFLVYRLPWPLIVVATLEAVELISRFEQEQVPRGMFLITRLNCLRKP